MRCPECNTEVDNKLKCCPSCGAPLPHDGEKREVRGEQQEVRGEQQEVRGEQQEVRDNEPRLGKGMMVFIVLGLLALAFFGVTSFISHQNDPEYTRTLIEPDTTLADRELVRLEEVAPPDTTKRDSVEQAEKQEAEKVFNSIRKRPVEEKVEEEAPAAEPSEEAPAPAETTTPAPEPAPAPTPKIEAIE